MLKYYPTLEEGILEYLKTGQKELHQILQFTFSIQCETKRQIRSNEMLKKLLNELETEYLICSYKPAPRLPIFYFYSEEDKYKFINNKVDLCDLILDILIKSSVPLRSYEVYNLVLERANELYFPPRNINAIKNRLKILKNETKQIFSIQDPSSKKMFYSSIK